MVTKIFMVDDHYMVIEGIRSMLQTEPGIEWMGHAMNAESCLAFLARHQPDILLMDIHLPDRSGIDLCHNVKQQYPGIFVIGLSTFNQYSFIHKMMENGASGYVLKNATLRELLEAFQTVLKGRRFLSHEASHVLRKPSDAGAPVLTRRELEVLALIAEGLTEKQIADKLFVASSTVHTHRKNLLAKFDARNTAILVRMATQLDLI